MTITGPDRDAVLTVLRELTDAWDRNDTDAYGALFTDDASYTTFVGSIYLGRAAIVESHRALFGKYLKGTRLADEVLDVRFPTGDTAVVVSRGDTYKGTSPKRLRKSQTYLLARQAGGAWRVAAFQNTKRNALLESVQVRSLPATAPSV